VNAAAPNLDDPDGSGSTPAFPRPAGMRGGSAGREVAVRSASKEGRRLARVRCLDRGRDVLVECVVYPASSLQVEPLRPGPYVFPSTAEATRFVDEIVLALEYLGCKIT
jgi:hypothetical protein